VTAVNRNWFEDRSRFQCFSLPATASSAPPGRTSETRKTEMRAGSLAAGSKGKR